MSVSVYTFPYSQDYRPPMPVVEISLYAPGRAPSDTLFIALIDSGADGTIVPIDILEGVGARYVGNATVRGIWEVNRSMDVYLASLIVGPYHVRAARVVAAPEGSEIILGRNVLNQLVITLNGLAGVTELTA